MALDQPFFIVILPEVLPSCFCGFGMKRLVSMPRLKGFRFPREIVACAVRACRRFAPGTADAEDLLAGRGVPVSRESVRHRVNRSGPPLADCIRRDRPPPRDKWHPDKAVILIGGRRCPRHSGAGAPECEGGKAVPAQADGPVRRPACRRHRHAAQRHEANSQSCARGKPPGAQGPEQQNRGLSPSNATTGENHGAVQVTPAGAGLSFRA